jgi:hypothetical protein
MKIGIDKVWLFSTSFKVHNAEYLNQNVPRLIRSIPDSTSIIEDEDGTREFKHKGISGNPKIYTDEQGTHVYGRSYLNTEEFNLDINQWGLKLNFNPSALQHPYELYGADILPKVQEQLKDLLFDNGIELNFHDALITRLDLTKQAETRQPCSNYANLFQYLHMPRYKDKNTYESGFTYGAQKSSKQVVFYDKREELLHSKKITLDANLTRCEIRYKKKAGKVTGIGRYGALTNIKPEQLEHIYANELTKLLKHPSGTQLTIDFPAEQQYLLHLKTINPKGYINNWLKKQGCISIMAKFGTRSNLLIFLKGFMNVKLAERKAREIEQEAITETFRITGAYISIDDMLKELQTHFL